MELVSVYKNDNHETSSKYSERGLDRDTYANKDEKLSYTESRARNHSKTCSVMQKSYAYVIWIYDFYKCTLIVNIFLKDFIFQQENVLQFSYEC